MNTTDIAIVGGGFSGIYSAWRLASTGAKVTLFEASEQLGGASLKSHQWHEHWLDNGTHNLDLRSKKNNDFFADILGSELKIIDQHAWASTIDTHWTFGLESPDLSVDEPELSSEILSEMQQLSETNGNSLHKLDDSEMPLSQWYQRHYGDKLSKVVLPMIRKATGADPHLMSAGAANTLGIFTRIKLDDDQEMIHRKSSSPFWNEKLAVTLDCNDERYLGSNTNPKFGYPASNGLAGFGKKAIQRLLELGVNVCTNETIVSIQKNSSFLEVSSKNKKINTKKLLWTLPDHLLARIVGVDTDIIQRQIPVGFSFYAFEVPRDCIAGPDYLHDFSTKTLAFRYSHPSRYTNAYTDDGFGYVLAEIPAHPGNMSSFQTQDIQDRVWSDLIASGYLLKGSYFRNATHWPLPVGFSVPRPGFTSNYTDYRHAIETRFPGLYTIEPVLRGRSAYIAGYDGKMHHKLL